MEWESWRTGTASQRDLIAAFGRIDDNDYDDEIDAIEERNAAFLEEALSEIDRRCKVCGAGYPFALETNGMVLRDRATGSAQELLYRYLLLGTMLDMNKQKVQNGVDGTALLERLSAETLRQYLGESKARALVFGTAIQGSFKAKVDHLCKEIKEGGGFKNIDPGPTSAKDGKLDSVAWIPFADSLPGKVILFCQCKTGSTWRGQITQLHPEDFATKFMEGHILVNPVRVFCVAESINPLEWNSTTVDGGILLDRCRIVELCEKVSPSLLDEVQTWVSAAMTASGITPARR
jgi:hypothetical protein